MKVTTRAFPYLRLRNWQERIRSTHTLFQNVNVSRNQDPPQKNNMYFSPYHIYDHIIRWSHLLPFKISNHNTSLSSYKSLIRILSRTTYFLFLHYEKLQNLSLGYMMGSTMFERTSRIILGGWVSLGIICVLFAELVTDV